MDVRVGPKRKVSTEEWILLNCGVEEDVRVPWTARRSKQSILRNSVLIFIGRTDAEAEAPIHWAPDVKN